MFSTSHPRLHQWVKPRSLLLHLVYALVAAGCLVAAWWQITRAAQGNTLSYLYSVEWPAFVVVGGIGWWQLVHDTDDDIARRREFHTRMRAASAEVVARTLPRSARALTVSSEEIPGRETALESAQAAALPFRTGGPTGTAVERLEASPALLPDDDEARAAVDELTEYNRYLALLAVKGKAKTWRNPRGI